MNALPSTTENATSSDYNSHPFTQVPCKKVIEELESQGVKGLEEQVEKIYQGVAQGKRGILLYGPSGTGKNLLARKLGPAMGINEQKIKWYLPSFVGRWETFIELGKKIKKLFEDAVSDDAELVIISNMDEITSLGYSRTDTAIKNVWSSTIDSCLEEYSNLRLIVIASKIQQADLWQFSYNLTVRVEVGLPNIISREKILHVCCDPAIRNKLFHEDVDLSELAAMTDGYSGGDLERLYMEAANYSLERLSQLKIPGEELKLHPAGKITMQDFKTAMVQLEREKKQPPPSPSQIKQFFM